MAVDPIAAPTHFTVSTGRVVNTPYLPQNGKDTPARPREAFADIFGQELRKEKELTFSKHAQLRLDERNMQLSPEQLVKMEKAVGKAGEKGVRDTLVLMDQMAFIVNVKSTTVITAMNGEDLKENVFTNIDGAVII